MRTCVSPSIALCVSVTVFIGACVEPSPPTSVAESHTRASSPSGKVSPWNDMRWVADRRRTTRRVDAGIEGRFEIVCTSEGYYSGTMCGVIRKGRQPSWGACGGKLEIRRGESISIGGSMEVGPVKVTGSRSWKVMQSFSVDVGECDCCALNACFSGATVRPWSCTTYHDGRHLISHPRNDTNTGRAVVHPVCENDDEGCGCVDAGTDAGSDGGSDAGPISDTSTATPDTSGPPPGTIVSPDVRTSTVDLRTPTRRGDAGPGGDAAVATEHSTATQRLALCAQLAALHLEGAESGAPYTDLAVLTDYDIEHYDLELDSDPFDCFGGL